LQLKRIAFIEMLAVTIMKNKTNMNVEQAYAIWSKDYDTNNNKTRDIEAFALRTTLKDIPFDNCLEIGCGTGKNTEWFLTKAKYIKAVDLSDEMLTIAKENINSESVVFQQADIIQPWTFADRKFDLINFSLVLEHIEYLEPIFKNIDKFLVSGGHVYLGELHPFKQYTGSKAKFETDKGEQIVNCFNHHISDFTNLANKYNLDVKEVNEFFDDNDRTNIPRVLTILLKKRK
jgi:ubiquinone/menaquinone biosynthesis C-methylase UbiE